MWPARPDEHEQRRGVACAETMLALAEYVGLDIDPLKLRRRRFAQHAGMLDAAEEPARRAELEHLVTEDFGELASAFKAPKRAVEQGGRA
jgi:hypothetical protein